MGGKTPKASDSSDVVMQVPPSSTQIQWLTWDMQESLETTQSTVVLQTSRYRCHCNVYPLQALLAGIKIVFQHIQSCHAFSANVKLVLDCHNLASRQDMLTQADAV